MARWAAAIVAALLAWLAVAPAAVATPKVKRDRVAGGVHWRVETESGPIHVWRPARFRPQTAGVVVYVHGFWTTVDKAWTEHRLPFQFRDSRQNALFVAPEAPSSGEEQPMWKGLGELLDAVRDGVPIELPSGPLVVLGHSGAWRTIVPWLAFAPLENVILLDALYGSEADFLAWLETAENHEAHQMTIVAFDTLKWAEPFVKQLADAVTRRRIPPRFQDLTRKERSARVLFLRSQIGHMELVTEGKTIPLLLRRSRLKAL